MDRLTFVLFWGESEHHDLHHEKLITIMLLHVLFGIVFLKTKLNDK